MSKRTIDNCAVAKKYSKYDGRPSIFTDENGKVYCMGYQRNEFDDEPIDECQRCELCISYGVE